MIFGMFNSMKIALIAGAVISAVGAFWYVSGLRADLERSQMAVQTLRSSVVEQQEVISTIREEQALIRQMNQELRELNRQQTQEIDNLRNRFSRSSSGESRDFSKLAAARPGLVENIINSASANASRCLEIASGAPLTEEEINATEESEINSECPSLANPNYSGDT